MDDIAEKKMDEPARALRVVRPVCPTCSVSVVRSEDLLAGNREVMIIHGEDVYRLMRTRNNKLILQK